MDNRVAPLYRCMWHDYELYKGESRLTLRMGFNMYGIHGSAVPSVGAANKPEYILEHMGGTVEILRLMFSYVPQLQRGLDVALAYEIAHLHDIGEPLTGGDTVDDGTRNEAEKDSAELAAFRDFVSQLPSTTRNRLVDGFQQFQEKSTKLGRLIYCADKSEAVAQGLVYARAGFSGNANFKQKHFDGVSDQDRACMAITGTKELAPNWALHLKQRIIDFPEAPHFLNFIRAGFDSVYGYVPTYL